jgi:hypothetical protein
MIVGAAKTDISTPIREIKIIKEIVIDNIDPTFSGYFALYSEIYFVVVKPNPKDVKTPIVAIEFLINPNSPYSIIPKVRANIIPANKPIPLDTIELKRLQAA